jgi:hypothetical protein
MTVPILHQPAGHGLIALGSLAAALLLYDLAVRRTGVTRFLFGLRPGQP